MTANPTPHITPAARSRKHATAGDLLVVDHNGQDTCISTKLSALYKLPDWHPTSIEEPVYHRSKLPSCKTVFQSYGEESTLAKVLGFLNYWVTEGRLVFGYVSLPGWFGSLFPQVITLLQANTSPQGADDLQKLDKLDDESLEANQAVVDQFFYGMSEEPKSTWYATVYQLVFFCCTTTTWTCQRREIVHLALPPEPVGAIHVGLGAC
ncbi:hypothetical protein HII31_12398 [Pseudocercospora fuligena]|uniref:Uncharacterized protein n=1 Tax=Pseudocercospora fuligena TaxID=685502 RepID=A0A8H6R883_9PEZI|nr:hypothetical protein HII31_12398 [Pseudocercospora fuligena]